MRYTWAIVWISVSLLTVPAAGVSPEEVAHATQADFASAQRKNVIVSSRGEVQLARTFSLRLPAGKGPVVVSDVAVAGDALYVASGNDNVVYKVTSDATEAFAQLPGTIVTSLLFTGDKLLAGTGGASKAGLYEIGPLGAVKTLWSDASVKYVWSILLDGKGGYYVATGAKAGIWHVSQNRAQAIYEVEPKLADHLLCLASDAKGLLYAGSDKNGLVFQVDPDDKSGRVLLDAEEKEIAALAPDAAGGIFAATSDASKAAAEKAPQPKTENTGRSDKVEPAKDAGANGARQEGSQEGPQGPDNNAAQAQKAGAKSTPSRSTGAAPAGPGNAIYYIHKSGMVETVFREKVTILDMILHRGRLYLATGHAGRILRVESDGDAHLPLVDTEAKQATSLALNDNGDVVFGTANPGSVGVVAADLAQEGTLTSQPLDAKQIATWGSARVVLSGLPEGTQVSLSTRTGNLAEPDEKTWSHWSQTQVVTGDRFLSLQSPAARFLQYRLHLRGRERKTPKVSRLELIRQVGNLGPTISAIKVTPANKAGGAPAPTLVYRMIEISAADGNSDSLQLSLFFRPVNDGPWIQMVKELTESSYAWDTRNVVDGTYELRVVVSDAPSNPPDLARKAARISETVTVDNTAPKVEGLQAARAGDRFVVTGKVSDATSRVVSMHYAIDGQDNWKALLPADGVADSQSEAIRFTIDKLDAGTRRILVRVSDVYGNTGYDSVVVNVP